MLTQHGLMPSEPLLIPQHSQIPVSISASQGVANLAIQAGGMHLEGHHNHQSLSHHSQQQSENMSNQQNQLREVCMSFYQYVVFLFLFIFFKMSQHSSHSSHNQHSQQQNMVQVQVQDNLVSVIEDSKEHKEAIANHIAQAHAHAQAHLHINENHHMNHQALTVQQLQHQVQQVLDNVVSWRNLNIGLFSKFRLCSKEKLSYFTSSFVYPNLFCYCIR